MALAGIILGSVAIVISAVFLGFVIWAIANDESGSGDDYDDPYATSLVVGADALTATDGRAAAGPGRASPGRGRARRHPARSRARASISANPSRFSPRQEAGSAVRGSSLASPMPHIRSSGLASTSTRSPVPSRYARSAGS